MSEVPMAGVIQPTTTVNAPYGASVGNIQAFQTAMSAAESGGGTPSPESPAFRAISTNLEKLNLDAQAIASHVTDIQSKGGNMTPGDMLMMTVKCSEFAFNCQLTSNVASRASDGVQQMFKQQS